VKLTQEQLQLLQTRLADREAELQRQVAAAKLAVTQEPGAHGREVVDPGEAGEERIRVGIQHVELQRDQQELRDIEEAGKRVADGSYGECIACGRDIPFERLKAQPSAARCVACQSEYEKTHPPAPRYSA
jgi:DnaK suppressor protein